MLIALQGAISQGVLWGIMVLGVFITFRLLDIPDMTCDAALPSAAASAPYSSSITTSTRCSPCWPACAPAPSRALSQAS
mgnify:FL=1